MRRIYIDKKIVDLSNTYAKSLFSKKNSDFMLPLSLLNDLELFLRYLNLPDYANYVKTIKDKYCLLLILKPQYFDIVAKKYFNCYSTINLSKKIQDSNKYPLTINYYFKSKKFYELIIDALRYDEVRNEFLPYIYELGITSCVYCNAQFATTIINEKKKYSGKYELDHYYPKSKYPFLCTSFFNLQPSCANCNKSKKDNPINFNLYTNDIDSISPFSFELEKNSLIKYMLDQKYVDLKLSFNCNDVKLKKNHEKNFHITELYETHKDVVEELIWKAKIYNKSYKDSLKQSFNNLFPNNTDFNRLILGNYTKPNQIHKRPLALLEQNIARQLKLII